MPRFDKDNAELQKHNAGHFGFSAAKIEDLGATEYTLVQIVVDVSGSTYSFRTEMEQSLKEVVRACQHSPRSDNLMIRLLIFADDVQEVHGFKLLENCNLDDYNDALQGSGLTALFDASVNGIEAVSEYGRQLMEQDYAVNGIVFVLTDGCENRSKLVPTGDSTDPKYVKEALKKAVQNENLESLVSILIGVNITEPMVSDALKDFNKRAGFTQYVEINNASKSTLAKLAQFVSKSISSQSQSLGTGSGSASLTF